MFLWISRETVLFARKPWWSMLCIIRRMLLVSHAQESFSSIPLKVEYKGAVFGRTAVVENMRSHGFVL